MYAHNVEIIVTGGAGYIGAHIVGDLISSGHRVIVIDDLSTGKIEYVNPDAIFVNGKVQDRIALTEAFEKISNFSESGVIHAAGLKFAGESTRAPLAFYEANCFAVLVLLQCMKNFGVPNLVFSSSSSVYGSLPDMALARESSALSPVSPYGRSKFFAENIIEDSKSEFELRSVSLRYFNVIGNGEIPAIDKSIYNLLPNLYRAMDSNSVFKVFGGDYPTKDGSCIRDYVDVKKLAEAHKFALMSLAKNDKLPSAINLGSGIGYSILEIIEFAKKIVGKRLDIQIAPGRTGDPARIVADCQLAEKFLSWSTKTDIEKTILDGWNAWQRDKIL